MTDENTMLAAIRGDGLPPAEQRARRLDDTPRLAYADWLLENAGRIECDLCRGVGKVQRRVERNMQDVTQQTHGKQGVWHRHLKCPRCLGDKHISDGRAERAEFIRVQIALTQPCPNGYSDAYHVDDVCPPCDAMAKRQRELFNECRADGGYANSYLWFTEPFGRFGFHPTLDPHPRCLINGLAGVVARGFVSEMRCSFLMWSKSCERIMERFPVTRVVLVFGRAQHELFRRERANMQQMLCYKWPAIEFVDTLDSSLPAGV